VNLTSVQVKFLQAYSPPLSISEILQVVLELVTSYTLHCVRYGAREGTSSVKPVDVDPERVELHDIGSSELSASTVSNSTLPQLEATNAERAQNEEERRRRRKAARKEKR
jgi:hypothetical protein